MSSEPNILVERHHIPLSVYLQLYGPSIQQQSQLPYPRNFSATRFPNNLFSTHTSTFTTSNNTASGNSPNERPVAGNRRESTNDNLYIHENQGSAAHQHTQNSTASARSRVRIETLATGDETDVNLFNALFAALINPSRVGSGNTTQHSGLTTEQIADNSTTMTYAEYENGNGNGHENYSNSSVCSICTLEYEPTQEVRSLDQCDHTFHIGCIDRWLSDHNTCPLCRAVVIPTSSSQQDSRQLRTSHQNRTSTSQIDLNGID